MPYICGMETPYSDEPESQEQPVEIYSRQAIVGFSIFFSTIFGGALLFINLWKVGYRKEAWQVLAFSIIYGLASSLAVNSISSPGSFVAITFNFVGAMLLSSYFFPKYFPDNDYYPKPIWSALAISIIASIGLLLAMYYSGNLPELEKALSKK